MQGQRLPEPPEPAPVPEWIGWMLFVGAELCWLGVIVILALATKEG